jgi:mRNA interferase RelE/StbE
MIKYHKRAEKFILSQEERNALRLYKAINKLPLGDIKRLQAKKNPPLFRLRVGDYRVIFCVENGITEILDVDNRGDVYK